MSITYELRKWAKGSTISSWTAEHLTAIADRIDAEHQKCIDAMWEDAKSHLSDESLTEQGWIRLPKDADGEYIHVGERVQLIGNDPSTVSHMSLADDGWRVYVKYDGEIGTGSGEPKRIRHYHAPTVEDVLREFGIDWEYESDCEDRAALLKEYAAKLRLAEGEDA